ncbi:MAG: dTDP-4-dehydrorhamnose reductase [Clostridia bacterium]|nr:dTDP-4-dehydrorhamnose reductase [Clostridia bacterium]
MRVMVTGSTGQLGYDTSAYLRAQGVAILAADRKELDLTDAESVKAYVDAYRPDAVIHCAAYTAVDAAETERTACELVNASATRTLAEICGKLGIKLVYISTDYVFDGSGTEPHETDETPAPLNVYGRTKLAGEEAVRELCPKHFIVRTSWVFGAHGNSFVKTILRLAETKDEIKVVDDQIGSPTYTKDLAPLLGKMIKTRKYGTYHATNEGVCSFCEFAREIVKEAGKDLTVLPTTTEEYGAKADRPRNSRLSKKSLDEAGFDRLPPWKDALHRFLEETQATA